MMKKTLRYLLMLCAGVFLCACSSDSFKIEGVLTDIGENNVQIIYVNEAGVQSTTAVPENGRFELVGVSPNSTVVYVYTQQKKLLTKVVMKNGDNLKMRGTVKHNYLIEMKGEDVNEDWNEFRRTHHLLYSENKQDELSDKIEEYVKENPDKLASLALLLYDYSRLDDKAKVYELLNSIPEELRLASLMRDYTDINAIKVEAGDSINTANALIFYNEKDYLEEFVPKNGKMSVMYFWKTYDKSHKGIVENLDSLFYNYMHTPKGRKQLQIADVVLDGDTAMWKRTLRTEDRDWEHYWAIGGHQHPTLKDLSVTRSPQFLVLDSVGKPLYNGDSIAVVERIIKERLVEMSDKKTVEEREKKRKAQEKKIEEDRKARQKLWDESKRKRERSKKLLK